MRELIDETNIENVLKFYEYVETSKSFIDGKNYSLHGFESIDYNFNENLYFWETNKKHLFGLMGGKLKITKELGDKNLCSNSMIRELRDKFIKENDEELNILIKLLLISLYPSEISNNKLARTIKILDVTMQEGWKVSKCFSALELNKKRLDRQQSLYSIFLQSLYIRGRLVLSIDPLDFITMSCSKSGWSSCHHPTGGYGVGSIAYMNDSATMIAYVETEQPMTATIFDEETEEEHTISMPNKIWRQAVTVNFNHSYALQMRQYPNDSEIYSTEVTNMLVELLEKSTGKQYLTDTSELSYENNDLQYRNSRLDKYVFYCDYHNTNFAYLTTVFAEYYGDIDNLNELSRTGEIETIEVGEIVYCACGCGDSNYSSHAFLEESDWDDEDFDENYDDDDKW